MEHLMFTLMVLLCSSTAAWELTIFRNSTNKLPAGLVDSIDQFNISKCNNSNLCTTFGGQKLQDKCQCVCSQDKSTFGFYSNLWGCTNNSIVQQYSGCQYNFEGPSGRNRDDDSLFTLPVLGPHNDNNYVRGIPANKSCKVIAANTTFLQCDGTWGRLAESNLTTKLAFQDQHPGNVYIGPYQTSSPVDPSLNGRVIRIPIKCEGQTWHPSQCVTFKIKGHLSCSTKKAPSLAPVSTQTYQSTTTCTPGTVNIAKTSRDGPTPAAAVIAGSVVGGVVFVKVLVLIITLVLRLKRKRNERIKNMKATGRGTNGAENQVTRTDAVTDSSLRQFPRQVMSYAEDNQEPWTTRQIQPHCQFSKVNHEDNWLAAGCKGETEPDYYQYPGVEMVPTKDNGLAAGCKGETEPDYYQYPGVEMVPTKDSENGPERKTVPNYQHPGVGMIPTKDETGPKRESTVSYYQYPTLEMVTSSESNSRPVSDRDDDSLYEIMNSPYQNIGNSRELALEHPYVNIC